MNTQIYQLSKIDFKNIGYNGPFNVDDMGNFTYITYAGKPFIVQTPTMILGDTTTPTDNLVYVPLVGKTKEITTMLNDFFYSLDKKFIGDIEKNAKKLGVTNEYKYNAIVTNHHITKKPYVAFRLLNKNSFETNVFGENKVPIPPSNYMKAFESCKLIKLIFEIASLFVNHQRKSIHINLKVYQVKITELKQMQTLNPMKDYAFVDSDSQLHDGIKNEIEICGLIEKEDEPKVEVKEKVAKKSPPKKEPPKKEPPQKKQPIKKNVLKKEPPKPQPEEKTSSDEELDQMTESTEKETSEDN